MKIIKNSLPLLFLAALFSFNECKRLDSAPGPIHGEVLPEVTAIILQSKSANLRRAAARQMAELNAQNIIENQSQF